MRILKIDAADRDEIRKATDYAKSHKFDLTEIKRIMEGKAQAAGFDAGFVTYLHNGYRVVYSLEEQPVGWCHHISISIEERGKLPHPEAIRMILGEFGMDSDFEDSPKMLELWIEDARAINILQKVEGTIS